MPAKRNTNHFTSIGERARTIPAKKFFAGFAASYANKGVRTTANAGER